MSEEMQSLLDMRGVKRDVVNDRYVDDYLRYLNREFSVSEILGKSKGAVAKGDRDTISKVVVGTLGVSEYENHLVSLLMAAAKEGTWTSTPRGTSQREGLNYVERRDFGYVATKSDGLIIGNPDDTHHYKRQGQENLFLVPRLGFLMHTKSCLDS